MSRREGTGAIGRTAFMGAVLIMIGIAIWAISAVVEVTDPDRAASTTTTATTAQEPVPAPAETAPASPAPTTVNLRGTGGVRTDPFPLAAVRYRVDYSYGSNVADGVEICRWVPSLHRATDASSFDVLPAGQGAMNGVTNVYVSAPGDYYVDVGATMVDCDWAMTFAPA